MKSKPYRGFAAPPQLDSKLRYYAFFCMYGDELDGPYEEVIGRLVRVDSLGREEDPSWPMCWELLYEDTEEGLLYYARGYEAEAEGAERYREVWYEFEEHGRTRSEIVEKIRCDFDPDFEIPPILEEPVPEVEDQHTVTGYDA